MNTLPANEVHVFIPYDFPRVYKMPLEKAGYALHSVDNLLDMGLQWANLGKPPHSVLMLKDENLSLHPDTTLRNFSKGLRDGKYLLSSVTGDDSTAFPTALINMIQQASSGAKQSPLTLQEINALFPEAADRITLHDGPNAIQFCHDLKGTPPPAVIVLGTHQDENKSYIKLGQEKNVRVSPIDIDRLYYSQDKVTLFNEELEKILGTPISISLRHGRKPGDADTPPHQK